VTLLATVKVSLNCPDTVPGFAGNVGIRAAVDLGK
jgi:hypothetical protein